MHISGSARALYRVFVAPSLRTAAIPLPSARHSLSPPTVFSTTHIRTKTYAKDTRRHALTDYYVIDGAIQSSHVNIVDDKGIRHHDMPLSDALALFTRTTHYLLQVSPGKVDESGEIDPHSFPVCRIVSKIDLRAQHERKLDTMRRQAKGQTTRKNLELNWAIAGGDLKHRLGKLKEFLREGRKVEVLLGPKKRGRKATVEEANDVLKALRNAAAECEGAREGKSEGAVGEVMTIVFEGKKTKGRKANVEPEAQAEEEVLDGLEDGSLNQKAAAS